MRRKILVLATEILGAGSWIMRAVIRAAYLFLTMIHRMCHNNQ